MQEVGSDTLLRDEVTGLAAFDNLDPISTVSTLNIMPEPPAPAPRIFTPPPRPAGSVAAPPPSYRAASVPPPAPSAARTFSRPPELAPVGAGVLGRADDTEIVDIADDNDNDLDDSDVDDSDVHATGAGSAASDAYEGWEDPDDAATRVAPFEGVVVAPAAELQMDWDDEELPTQMRGEGGMHLGDDLSTAAFEPVANTFPSGRPSPFPGAHTHEALGYAPVGSLPPPGALPSVRPSGAPSPFSRAAEQQDTAWGQELRGDRPMWLWVAAGAVAIIGLGIAARAWLAAPTPGIVTLTTIPSDAHVLIDGKAVLASASPFSATDIAPGVGHELVVQKDGFVEQRVAFTVNAGESKALPEMKLVAVAHDMGFAVDSNPSGADVLVDGQSVGQVTPARVTKISVGLHKLQLTHTGYQPFEVQAFVTDNAVLELPTAQLVPATGKAAVVVAAAAAAPAALDPLADSSAAHHHHHHTGTVAPSRFGGSMAAAAPVARAPKLAAPARVAMPAPVAAGGAVGKGGLLRVNSRPWSQVFVDGRLAGNTPQMALQLAPGNHTIKLVNQPMGLSKSFSVSVKAGQTVTKVMNLIE